MQQNFKNHRRFRPLYHFVILPAILVLIAGAFDNYFGASADSRYSAFLICLISLIMLVMFFQSRGFGLTAQDRAIRAEENLRHYVLTGKPLDSRLLLGQIIALRFAPDDELVALAKRAAEEKLSSRDIKREIKNWRGDYHRV